MKAGDIIRVVKVPAGLPDESRKVFEFCLGKCFPISQLEEHGIVEVLVGRLTDGDEYFHTIDLEPGEFELAPDAKPDEIISFTFPDGDDDE